MSRVMDAWNEVLREAVSGDYDDQQFALFQIGLILQRHNPYIQPESDVHEETLSRELLRLTLNHDRQSAAVEYLAELAQRQPENADSFLYAMSNAQPMILAEPLLDLMLSQGATWDDSTAYQALRALNGCLLHGDDDVLQQIQDPALNPLLEQWADSDDALLSAKATSIQNKLHNLREGYSAE
jgi:hypothetical protein